MQTNRPSPTKILPKTWLITGFAVVLFLAAIFYANLRFSSQNSAGFDFLLRWYPARLVVFEGFDSPYSEAATREVEIFLYGRPAQGGELEGYFAYPYYTIFVILPFVLIEDFPIARSLWMTVLELSHIAIVFLSLRMLHFKPKTITLFLLLAGVLISSYFIQPIIDGNPASLAGLFIVLCYFFLSKNKDWLAGIFLALATIKPQMTILFFVLVWIWSFSNRRWKVIYSSAIGVGILMGASFALQPGWFLEFIDQMLIYGQKYGANSTETVLKAALPAASREISLGLTILSVGLLIFEWVQQYRKGFQHFLWTTSITFALLPLTGIVFGNQNMSILIPAMVLLTAAVFKQFPKYSGVWNGLLLIFILASWAALYLLYNFPLLFYTNYLPLPLVITIGLYLFRGKVLEENLPGMEKA